MDRRSTPGRRSLPHLAALFVGIATLSLVFLSANAGTSAFAGPSADNVSGSSAGSLSSGSGNAASPSNTPRPGEDSGGSSGRSATNTPRPGESSGGSRTSTPVPTIAAATATPVRAATTAPFGQPPAVTAVPTATLPGGVTATPVATATPDPFATPILGSIATPTLDPLAVPGVGLPATPTMAVPAPQTLNPLAIPTVDPALLAAITSGLAGSPATNDDFAAATVIGELPFTDLVDTSSASSAADDPDMLGGSRRGYSTVWYRYLAPSTARLSANTFGSFYDTAIAVFEGSRGALRLIASNDDAESRRLSSQSEVIFDVSQGVEYYLEVAGVSPQSGSGGPGSSSGRMRLTVEVAGEGQATPALARLPGAVPVQPALGPAQPAAVPGGPAPGVPAASLESRYFSQTGFRVARDAFWDYFQRRGGVRTFGYPISREFMLLGSDVQMFQRGILQAMPDGGVARMNLLDEGLMPYNQINFSTFPAPEQDLILGAPSARDPNYGEKALAFLLANVPDQWEGLQVNFRQTFLSTVSYEDAFPYGEGDPALVPYLNLEIWGLPTSRPARDPNNNNFVYQRFQRGIIHFDAATGATEGQLLADDFKSILTGRNLPDDLAEQARSSRFFAQYDRSVPGHVARARELEGTLLVDAFEPEGPR